METNAQKSLVVFAIAERPLTGSLDLENIFEFDQLHTVRGSDECVRMISNYLSFSLCLFQENFKN